MVVFGGLGAAGRLGDVWVLEVTQGRVLDVPPLDPAPPIVHRVTGFSRAPFPNPATGTVRFTLAVSHVQSVRLTVSDIAGRRVAMLQNGVLEAGEYPFEWRGADDSGRHAPAGLYFLRLDTPDRRETRRLVLAQ